MNTKANLSFCILLLISVVNLFVPLRSSASSAVNSFRHLPLCLRG